LTPGEENSLTLQFMTDFFRPGRYSLVVEGLKKEGGEDLVGHFPFFITKPR